MNSILGIQIHPYLKSELVDEVIHRVEKKEFTHIVSLNPEILVEAYGNTGFKHLINSAHIKIVDGVGVVLAGRILSVPVGDRLVGVDLMEFLIKLADKKRLNVLILGGYNSVASDLAEKLKNTYEKAEFRGIEGYENIHKPTETEEKEVEKVLTEFNPHIIFIAFGAPHQEYWVSRHREFLSKTMCMSVGGAADFLAGKVPRAPVVMRKMGFEWLFRLIIQPWRWKRQLKLIVFMWLVIKQKFTVKPRLTHL